jgi:hypothetical protein
VTVWCGQTLLLGIVDSARGHEIKEAIGEHLCVNAEIAVAVQLGEHGVGQRADAELEAGAILDERCNVTTDGALDVVGAAM